MTADERILLAHTVKPVSQTNVQIRVLWAKINRELHVNMHPMTLRLFHYDQLVLRRQFQNQPPIGWLKKIQNRDQHFIIRNSHISNYVTSPHSCHPHLGTCCTVTLVCVVNRQTTLQLSDAAIC